VLHDLRYAIRGFAAHPGFTFAAVLSLAIGIGANAALFSVTSALLLRPLPYQDADRLVILWNRSPGLNIAEDWFSTAQYFDIKNSDSGFEQVAIAIGANYNLTERGDPERIGVIRASSNLLPMLGARPAVGRLLVPEGGCAGRGMRGRDRSRHVGPPLRARPARRRHVDHVERPTLPLRNVRVAHGEGFLKVLAT
jgi:MacB-like periplasmic core domain